MTGTLVFRNHPEGYIIAGPVLNPSGRWEHQCPGEPSPITGGSSSIGLRSKDLDVFPTAGVILAETALNTIFATVS